MLGADQPLVQPDKVRQAGVFIGNFDSCTNTMLLSANGSYAVDKNSFQVSSQLTVAELTTSLNVHDFVSTSALDVSVDMTWVEAGTLLRDQDNIHIESARDTQRLVPALPMPQGLCLAEPRTSLHRPPRAFLIRAKMTSLALYNAYAIDMPAPDTLTRRGERIASIHRLSIDTIELYERNMIGELALRLVDGELPAGT